MYFDDHIDNLSYCTHSVGVYPEDNFSLPLPLLHPKKFTYRKINVCFRFYDFLQIKKINQ